MYTCEICESILNSVSKNRANIHTGANYVQLYSILYCILYYIVLEFLLYSPDGTKERGCKLILESLGSWYEL